MNEIWKRKIDLAEEIRAAINRHSIENVSNTPDFILAAYLGACLNTFEEAVISREAWYGRCPPAPVDDAVQRTECWPVCPSCGLRHDPSHHTRLKDVGEGA